MLKYITLCYSILFLTDGRRLAFTPADTRPSPAEILTIAKLQHGVSKNCHGATKLSGIEPSYLRRLVTNSKTRWFKRQRSSEHRCIFVFLSPVATEITSCTVNPYHISGMVSSPNLVGVGLRDFG